MKILVRILGVLAVLASFLFCTLGASRNFEDAEEVVRLNEKMDKDIEELKQNYQAGADAETTKKLEEIVAELKQSPEYKKIPSKDVFENSGMLIATLLVLALVSSVFLFLPRKIVSITLLCLSVLATVALIMIAPDMGEKSRATNVQVAWLSSLPAVSACFCAFLNALLSKKSN